MLSGTEVKSLRTGKATIAESYASVDRAGEVCLVNAISLNTCRPTVSTTTRNGHENCC